MLMDRETLADLRARFPTTGIVSWIGIRPKPRAAMHGQARARLLAGHGIQGDHRARRQGGRRQVTLIQAEHLPVIASLMNRERVDPAQLRRNIVVAGLNLSALKGVTFRLGHALLTGTGACHPCSRMEQVLGPGGYNAMRGHGGITAVVLQDGDVALGGTLRVEQESLPAHSPD